MDYVTDSKIIDDAGGPSVVAAHCGVLPSAVSNWRHDGIPAARRWQIAQLIAKRAKTLPADYYERSVPPPRHKTSAAE